MKQQIKIIALLSTLFISGIAFSAKKFPVVINYFGHERVISIDIDDAVLAAIHEGGPKPEGECLESNQENS